MSKLQTVVKKSGKDIEMNLVGPLDEDARLDANLIANASTIHLNFGSLTMLNSMGIRELMLWISSAPRANFTYSECTPLMVKQMNIVRDFLIPRGKVQSFYVPYCLPNGKNRRLQLFTRGVEFGDSGLIKIPEVKDDTGVVLEPDIDEVLYFRFLNVKGS